MKKLLLLLALVPLVASAAGPAVRLDRAPVDGTNVPSLQRGAALFANYCLGCHSAEYMRYNRLQELGLTEGQIRDNLMFTAEKVGETMHGGMKRASGAEWFGVAPPDLTVVARSRGADWLYTYMRTFYRDPGRESGWNNVVFPNVGMPHVFWNLQGIQELKVESATDASGHKHETRNLVLAQPGALTPVEYDQLVGDLVNYLVYMGEPARLDRVQIGVYVLLFLIVMIAVTWLLKQAYWKEVH